jgi:hypothetical protein
MKRRKCIATGIRASLAAGTAAFIPRSLMGWGYSGKVDERSYLGEILYSRREVDYWLAGKAFPFSKYHARFGWLLNNAVFQDGIDGSTSVYDLCDLEKTHEIFQDDFVLNIMLAHRNSELINTNTGYEPLTKLIRTHGIETNLDHSNTLDHNASEIHRLAAVFSSKKIVDKVEAYARSRQKKVLYVLSFPGDSVAEFIREGKRSDLEFVSYLESHNLPYIDLLQEHERDFKQHNLDMESYINKYFIGHYTSLGNFFCANALKEALRVVLEPAPFPYLKTVL